MSHVIIYANLAVSWGLLVLIWMVQVIIYPGFLKFSGRHFEQYHRWYAARMTFIVAPLMLAEAVLAALWILEDTTFKSVLLVASPMAVVWLSTFTLQVPIHKRLTRQSTRQLMKRLVLTNWIRTVAWSAKAAGVLTVVTWH